MGAPWSSEVFALSPPLWNHIKRHLYLFSHPHSQYSDTRGVGFSPQCGQISNTSVLACKSAPSDTTHLELASGPTGFGLIRLPSPPRTPVAGVVPRLPTLLSELATDWGLPDALLGFDDSLSWPTELRGSRLPVYSSTEEAREATEGQPGERCVVLVPEGSPLPSLYTGASVPVLLGRHRCTGTWMCLSAWELSQPVLEGFLRRLHHTGVIDGPLNLQPLSLRRGRGVWPKTPSFSSQLGPSGDRPPPRSHRETTESLCIRIKDAPITQKTPEGSGALCPRPRPKDAPDPFYCLENDRAFRSSGQELGLHYRIYISS